MALALTVTVALAALALGAKGVPSSDPLCQVCTCNGSSAASLLELYCINVTVSELAYDSKYTLHKVVASFSDLHTPVLKKSELVYPALQHLQLTNNSIRIVEREAFGFLNTMEYLDLSDNYIDNLNCDVLASNTFLHTLILAGNRIRIPTHRPFLSIPSLLHLDLSRCSINELPALAFQKMTSLVTLNLSNNAIDLFFGDEFSKLKQLAELNLNYNGIKSINESTFQNNRELKKLSLTGNNFLVFNTAGFDFLHIPSLQMLWLDDCGLTTLPSYSFGNLKNLKMLSVNDNVMRSVNFGELQQLPSLLQLDALSNRLECGCVRDYKQLCCSERKLQVLATCEGTSWEEARNRTCSDGAPGAKGEGWQEESLWGWFKPWHWKAAASIGTGCVVMVIISLLLLKGPRMCDGKKKKSVGETIYIT